jgi:hypothetical protein
MLGIVQCRDHLRTASPAPYGNVMASSFIKLFSGGKRFSHFWDTLEVSLHDACTSEFDRDATLTQGVLFTSLRRRFTLHPVLLLPMRGITIQTHQSLFKKNGELVRGHQVTAHVPFTGSKLLLQSQPEPGFQFAFRGRVTKHALHLHGILPDLDGRDFGQAVEAELERIKPLLSDFRKTVSDYDNHLIDRLRSKISTF